MKKPLQDEISEIVETFIDESETLPYVMEMVSNDVTLFDSIWKIGHLSQQTTAKFTAFKEKPESN